MLLCVSFYINYETKFQLWGKQGEDYYHKEFVTNVALTPV